MLVWCYMPHSLLFDMQHNYFQKNAMTRFNLSDALFLQLILSFDFLIWSFIFLSCSFDFLIWNFDDLLIWSFDNFTYGNLMFTYMVL